MSVFKSLAASFKYGLVGIFETSTIHIFLALSREVATERSRSVPATKMWLKFVKAGYQMGAMVPTIWNDGSDKKFVRDTDEY